MTIQELIQARFSGQPAEGAGGFEIMYWVGGVLVAGIIMWRISNKLHAQKQRAMSQRNYFESKYSKAWKKR